MALDLKKRLTKQQTATRDTLLKAIEDFPALEDRIFQHFLVTLHSRGITSIDEIYENVAISKTSTLKNFNEENPSENIHRPSRWSKKERKAIHSLVLKLVAIHFPKEEVEDYVRLVVRREEVKNLEDIARLPNVSFDLLASKVKEFCSLPRSSMKLPISDILATRVCLIHHFVSDQLDFIGIAKKYLRIIDLNKVAQNTIGPKRGMGRIGGKAAGMVLSNRIVKTHLEEFDKDLAFPIRYPESYYLRADLYYDFIHKNGLSHYYDQKYKPSDEVRREYPVVKEIFKNGTFSNSVQKDLKNMLRKIGKNPIIVRSSSLLEDNFGSAFCGKYRSIYLPNQGTEKQRFEDLVGAITAVYASIMHPDPITYRRKRNLLDYDEMMGVLIQRVVGKQFGDYFFPLFSGVAYSRNEYRWSPRIRKEDGMLRMVMGLGTRAVDRVSSDYPRIVALTEPSLKAQVNIDEIIKYSQHNLDVINLVSNQFETVKLRNALKQGPIDSADLVVSTCEEGHLKTVIGKHLPAKAKSFCVTFDKLIKSTTFTDQMSWILGVLQKTYGCPVDIEFSCDGDNFYLLQCRPLSKQLEWDAVTVPRNIDSTDQVFSANRDVQNGIVENIDYVIYVPAEKYEAVGDHERKLRIARAVGAINQKLCDKRFVLVGPGRWGSNDINLGVKVSYNDISNTKALIEVAHSQNGYVPELSFGTHFFQDLVESGIFYLPLYPEEEGNVFNQEFLTQQTNALASLLPDYADMNDVVQVIDVAKAANGKRLQLYMNGEQSEALAFIG